MKVFHEISVTDLHDNVFTEIGERWMLISAEKDGVTNTMTASLESAGCLYLCKTTAAYESFFRSRKSFLPYLLR